jgi:hypothetical protein
MFDITFTKPESKESKEVADAVETIISYPNFRSSMSEVFRRELMSRLLSMQTPFMNRVSVEMLPRERENS